MTEIVVLGQAAPLGALLGLALAAVLLVRA